MLAYKFKYKLINKSKISKLSFYISFSIYLFTRIISLSLFGYFPGTRFIIATCVLILLMGELIYISNTSYKTKNIFGLLLVLFICLIAEYNGMGYFISSAPIYIYCAKNVYFEEITKITLIITSVCLAVIVLSSQIGFLTDYIYYNQGRIRHTLGFSYSLIPACFTRNIIFLKLYKDKEKIKWKTLFVLFFLSVYMFKYTNARLNIGLSIIALIIATIFKIKPNIKFKNKLIIIVMISSFIIFFLISVFLTINYNPKNTYYFTMNMILNNRLKYGHEGITTYGISFLGKEIVMIGSGLTLNKELESILDYNYIDCLYVQMLINYGIIATAIIILLLTFTMYKCYKDKDYYLMIIMTLLAAHMLIDDYVIQLGYNTFMLIIGIKLLEPKQKNVDNKLI